MAIKTNVDEFLTTIELILQIDLFLFNNAFVQSGIIASESLQLLFSAIIALLIL